MDIYECTHSFNRLGFRIEQQQVSVLSLIAYKKSLQYNLNFSFFFFEFMNNSPKPETTAGGGQQQNEKKKHLNT